MSEMVPFPSLYTHLHLDFIEWINHGIQSIYIFKSSKKISFKVLFRTKVLRWERTFLGELFTTFQRPLRILDKNVQTFRHLHQNSYLKISILTIFTFNIPTNYVAYIIQVKRLRWWVGVKILKKWLRSLFMTPYIFSFVGWSLRKFKVKCCWLTNIKDILSVNKNF